MLDVFGKSGLGLELKFLKHAIWRVHVSITQDMTNKTTYCAVDHPEGPQVELDMRVSREEEKACIKLELLKSILFRKWTCSLASFTPCMPSCARQQWAWQDPSNSLRQTGVYVVAFGFLLEPRPHHILAGVQKAGWTSKD